MSEAGGILVELGNDSPIDTVSIVDPDTGESVTAQRPGAFPVVSTIVIPSGRAGRLIGLDPKPGESYEDFKKRDAEHAAASEGDPLYSMPDEHSDDVFAEHDATKHIADALAGVPDDAKAPIRRAMIDGQFAANSGAGGLPNHEAFSVVAHPNGFWRAVAAPGTKPAWVRVDGHPGLEAMLAEYFDCEVGPPDDFEDVYQTRYGASTFPPGAAPDPMSGITMGHTTFGRVNQAIQMGGYGFIGQSGLLTASSSTTATLAAGASITLNQLAGQWIFCAPSSTATGSSTVYGLIISNTASTTPVVTIDRWYAAATPGGSAGTTPSATASYLIASGGPPSMFVALSTDTTAFSLGGTGGTQDAATIAQTLTGEITTGGGGLIRKIAPIGQSSATWTATPVFTANGSDSLPATVAKAGLSPSLLSTNGALDYMTLVSPTAVMSASGDQLTLTWTFTMT
jgi:hypothetical protein